MLVLPIWQVIIAPLCARQAPQCCDPARGARSSVDMWTTQGRCPHTHKPSKQQPASTLIVLEWQASDPACHSPASVLGSGDASPCGCAIYARILTAIHNLDAVILENGQSVFSQLPKDVVEVRTKAAQQTSGGLSIPAPSPSAFGITDTAQTQFVASHLTPHPFQTYVSPLKLESKVGNDLPTSYIVCTDPIYKTLETSRNWVKAAGWKTIEIRAGHDAMVIAPEGLAELLDADDS